MNNQSEELPIQEYCEGKNVFFTPDVSEWGSPAVKHGVLDMVSFCHELAFRPIIAKKDPPWLKVEICGRGSHEHPDKSRHWLVRGRSLRLSVHRAPV